MHSPSSASWTVRGATFALWLLAAGSAAYWALQLGGPGEALAPAAPATRAVAAIDPAAIARLLGADAPSAPGAAPLAPAPDIAARFALVGVVAGASGGGAAVISVDGKPARPLRVGTVVDEGIVVQAVQGRRAVLGQRSGAPLVTLELPPLQQPQAAAPAPLPQAGSAQRPTPNAAPR